MSAHHPFGGSSLYRRYLCPGSYHAESGTSELRDPAEAAAAQAGTNRHEMIAEYIQRGLDNGFDSLAFDFDDPDDERYLLRCLEVFKQEQDRLGDMVCEFLEHRIDSPYPDGAFGTADVVFVSPDKVSVIDWKFWHEPPNDAALAFQLSSYLVGLRALYGPNRSYRGIAYNPILDQITFVDLPDDAEQTIKAVVDTAMAKDAKLLPGVSQCRYCRAVGTCPAVERKADELAHTDIGGGALEADKLAHLLDLAALADTHAKAVRALARKRLQEGGEIPGYSLKPKNGERKADVRDLYDKVADHADEDEFFEACSVSVAQVEKKLVKKWRDSEKAAKGELTVKGAKARFAKLTSSVVEQPKIQELRRVKR
ncbi:MAG: DUF2800 domain-containing protein [Solirubrobacterales bacterium]